MDKFHLVEQAVRAHHIGITLIEFAITAFLRTVGSPHGLYLITAEGKRKFLAVLHHIAGEGHGQVVAQAFLAQLGGQSSRGALLQSACRYVAQEVTAVQNLEEQFVALFAILAHQHTQILHGRSLYLLEAIELVHLTDGVEDIIASGHLLWSEVPCPFWD